MRGKQKVRDALTGTAEDLQVEQLEPVHGGRARVDGVDEDSDQAQGEKHDTEAKEPSGETGQESVSRSDAEKEPEGGKHCGGIADDSGNEGDELGVDELVLHDACKSVCLTFLLFNLLVLCGLWGEAPTWKYFTAFLGGYGVLFAACCGLARRRGSDEESAGATAFVESRMAIAMLGVGAIAFGSTVLLEIVPDVIVVAGVLGGISDGNSVGAIARQRGCSVLGSVGFVLRMGEARGRRGRSKP